MVLSALQTNLFTALSLSKMRIRTSDVSSEKTIRERLKPASLECQNQLFTKTIFSSLHFSNEQVA
jgi:hypothetical protein